MTQRDSRRRAGPRALLVACLAAIALAAIATAYARGPDIGPAPGSVALPATPSSPSRSSSPTREPLGSTGSGIVQIGRNGDSAWAPVISPTAARSAPSVNARLVGRVATTTPEGTSTIVPALRRTARAGNLWVEIGLPVLPNGTTGWVRRSALGGYEFLNTRLDVSLRTRTITLSRAGKRVFTAPIGVGQAKWPTPKGTFLIRNKLTRYASPTYGPLAFGTSARSAVLTDWPAGGFIGIHGTDRPGLIPGRISHGCVRLRNADITRLARLMPLGTPVTIH